MYAAAPSLDGQHAVVVAGNSNIYMDVAINPATEHLSSAPEACGFWMAAGGGTEKMTPRLRPSRHRVDAFPVNKPLLPWSLQESVTKNILNWCPKGFDENLQVVELENRTAAASRAEQNMD